MSSYQSGVTDPRLMKKSVSQLVHQHKREVLNGKYDLSQVIQNTFNHEFVKMLLNCIFTPLLHRDTPSWKEVDHLSVTTQQKMSEKQRKINQQSLKKDSKKYRENTNAEYLYKHQNKKQVGLNMKQQLTPKTMQIKNVRTPLYQILEDKHDGVTIDKASITHNNMTQISSISVQNQPVTPHARQAVDKGLQSSKVSTSYEVTQMQSFDSKNVRKP